jgi:hypothetical protein
LHACSLTVLSIKTICLGAQAPQAGEIVDFVVDEGTAVEYNQPIVELMPFFGGHIIGDRKHA